LASFLDKSRTVAPPGYSRWLIPPAALCVHLCIGQAYAFSVFNLPMTKLLGITKSAPDDWNIPQLGWIFTIGIFVARLFPRRSSGAGSRMAGPARRCSPRLVLRLRLFHLGDRRRDP